MHCREAHDRERRDKSAKIIVSYRANKTRASKKNREMRMKLRQLEEDQRNKIKQNALQLENYRNKIQMAKENACARIKDCVHSFDRDMEKNLIKNEGDRILLNGRGFTKIPLDLYVGQNARNNLSSVIIIDLSSNYLEELPSSGFFYFLQNLRKLILSMNNLRTIQS